MFLRGFFIAIGFLLLTGLVLWWERPQGVPAGREEVVFWHFWGGEDLEVVRDVVRRFNQSQEQYWVREIAMPGNNLQAKLFLSIAGGSPPDLVNQDDSILADWTESKLILPIDQVGPAEEVRAVQEAMLPGARKLSEYRGRMMAVCNGLDVRALIYNDTALEQAGLSAPSTMEEFNSIIGTLSPPGRDRDRAFYTFLPDHRRLWAWGGVFGGAFVDADNSVELDHPGTVAALRWMQSFSRDYGSDNLAAFRTADQSLPGKAFPLLPISDDAVQGRYLFVMDGQWRIRDIERFNARREAEGKSEIEFGVCALPPPAGGREQAGWINGNFFVVPRGAKQKRGAWEFMKFWIGHDTPAEAAETCQAGGWIPVSPRVLSDPSFQEYLTVHPLFSKFIELAVSPNQIPIPIIPGAEKLKRELNQAVFGVMQDIDAEPEDALRQVATPSRIQKHQKGESP